MLMPMLHGMKDLIVPFLNYLVTHTVEDDVHISRELTIKSGTFSN